MNYLGGKHRQGPRIAELMLPHIVRRKTYIEPFCGAMGVATRVVDGLVALRACDTEVCLSDIQQSLITMWAALLNTGWKPPRSISQQTYDRVKAKRDSFDPMTAYVGYGMSFGGKFFGGYARNGVGTDYALNAQRSTLLKVATLLKMPVGLYTGDYTEWLGFEDAVFYMDPPYYGRTRQFAGSFKHDDFWNNVRALSKRNDVFVTEFIAPDDFVPIHEFGDTVVRHHSSVGKDGTNECIFVHKSSMALWGDK